MVLREFDGLGFGIKNHDAIIAVWTHPAAPRAGSRPIVLTFK
jgi:hypothetical protein